MSYISCFRSKWRQQSAGNTTVEYLTFLTYQTIFGKIFRCRIFGFWWNRIDKPQDPDNQEIEYFIYDLWTRSSRAPGAKDRHARRQIIHASPDTVTCVTVAGDTKVIRVGRDIRRTLSLETVKALLGFLLTTRHQIETDWSITTANHLHLSVQTSPGINWNGWSTEVYIWFLMETPSS